MKKSLGLLILSAGIVFAVTAGFLIAISSQKESFVSKKIQQDLQKLAGTEAFVQGLIVKASPMSWKKAQIKIQKIELKNPKGFSAANLAVIEDVEIECDPLSLFLGRWRIAKLTANIAESYIELGLNGNNLAAIPSLQLASNVPESAPSTEFSIQRLELKLEKLYYVDPSSAKEAVTEFDMENKMEVFDQVKNPKLLIQAPVLSFLNKLNKGSFGLSRGLIQASVKQSLG